MIYERSKQSTESGKRRKNQAKSLLRLLSALSPLDRFAILLCLLISVITNLGGSYQLRSMINLYLWPGCKEFEEFYRRVFFLLLIFLAGAVAMYFQSMIMVNVSHNCVNVIRRSLFEHMQKLPLEFFDRTPRGEMMSRFMNDAGNIQHALEQSAAALLADCLMFIGIVSLMLYINWLLFLLTVPAYLLLLMLFRHFAMQGSHYFRKRQELLGSLNGMIQESIEGAETIRLFNHESPSIESFRKKNDLYREVSEKAGFVSSVLIPLSGSIADICYAFIAVVGSILAFRHGFDLGGLIVFLYYCRQLNRPVNDISQHLGMLLSALSGSERIFSLMEKEAEEDRGNVRLVRAVRHQDGSLSMEDSGETVLAWNIPSEGGLLQPGPDNANVAGQKGSTQAGQKGFIQAGQAQAAWQKGFMQAGQAEQVFPEKSESRGDARNPAKHPEKYSWKNPTLLSRVGDTHSPEKHSIREALGEIEFRHVNFSYQAGRPVLKDINFHVGTGQKFALVGATGAGKTTIAKLINRFYDAGEGVILLDGIDIRKIRREDLHRFTAYIPQDPYLFEESVLENIRFGNPSASDEDCREAARLVSADQLIRRLPEGYQTVLRHDGLSAGQRQLLAVARAAVADPPVLILDEATSAVDSRTELLIRNGIASLSRNRTVFVIAHRLSTAQSADRILVIENGQIAEEGSHEELLAKEGLYYRLYTV